jgi:hypothetical protein
MWWHSVRFNMSATLSVFRLVTARLRSDEKAWSLRHMFSLINLLFIYDRIAIVLPVDILVSMLTLDKNGKARNTYPSRL